MIDSHAVATRHLYGSKPVKGCVVDKQTLAYAAIIVEKLEDETGFDVKKIAKVVKEVIGLAKWESSFKVGKNAYQYGPKLVEVIVELLKEDKQILEYKATLVQAGKPNKDDDIFTKTEEGTGFLAKHEERINNWKLNERLEERVKQLETDMEKAQTEETELD